MTAPITLPSLDEPTLTELRRRYEGTSDAETRTRYQMLLLMLHKRPFKQAISPHEQARKHVRLGYPLFVTAILSGFGRRCLQAGTVTGRA
jgi:hypothetical protein